MSQSRGLSVLNLLCLTVVTSKKGKKNAKGSAYRPDFPLSTQMPQHIVMTEDEQELSYNKNFMPLCLYNLYSKKFPPWGQAGRQGNRLRREVCAASVAELFKTSEYSPEETAWWQSSLSLLGEDGWIGDLLQFLSTWIILNCVTNWSDSVLCVFQHLVCTIHGQL